MEEKGGKEGGLSIAKVKSHQGGYFSSRDKQVRVRVPLFFDLERFLSFCLFFFWIFLAVRAVFFRCLIICIWMRL